MVMGSSVSTQRIDEVSSAGKGSRNEQKIFTGIKDDVEQHTMNIPVVMRRQVLVIQKAPRPVDIPLLQYIDTTVDVPVAKQRRENTTETARRLRDTLHNEIQENKNLRSA